MMETDNDNGRVKPVEPGALLDLAFAFKWCSEHRAMKNVVPPPPNDIPPVVFTIPVGKGISVVPANDSIPDLGEMLLPDFLNRDLTSIPFPFVDFDGMKSIFGRQWKVCLKNVGKIASHFRSTEYPVVTVSQSSSVWIEKFHSQSSVSRAVSQAIAIGLLTPVSDWCEGFSRRYAYNRNRETDVLNWCESCNIPLDSRPLTPMELVDCGNDAEITMSRVNKTPVKFTITQRCSLPGSLTDEEIINGLVETYPQLREAWEIVERLNRNLPEGEKMSFIPHIGRSATGRVTKIGIRCTNPLVSTKKEDDNNPRFLGMLREEVLKDKLGDWVEYDVKASIPTISMLLTKGVLRKDGEDLYSRIAGFDFENETDRRMFKALFLPLYFEKTGRSAVWHRVRDFEPDAEWRMEQSAIAQSAMDRLDDVCGRMGSEVFLHESCIYLNAFARMIEEEGWRVIQIYDGFYVQVKDGDNRDEIRERAGEIVRDEMRKYAARWFGFVNFCKSA